VGIGQGVRGRAEALDVGRQVGNGSKKTFDRHILSVKFHILQGQGAAGSGKKFQHRSRHFVRDVIHGGSYVSNGIFNGA
jgi:hypothetical protein